MNTALWILQGIVATALTASGLIIMLLAMRYHISKKEYKDIPATIIFMVLAVFIAFNRF